MEEELKILEDHLQSKGMRRTPQRENILRVFLEAEHHISLDQLHRRVAEKYPSIGYVTVYRTMKLLEKLGLCEEIDIGDGLVRYEHKYGHEHHDHLVCTKCGKLIEVRNSRIEELQALLANEKGFVPTRHRLEIFGYCRECIGSGGK